MLIKGFDGNHIDERRLSTPCHISPAEFERNLYNARPVAAGRCPRSP